MTSNVVRGEGEEKKNHRTKMIYIEVYIYKYANENG